MTSNLVFKKKVISYKQSIFLIVKIWLFLSQNIRNKQFNYFSTLKINLNLFFTNQEKEHQKRYTLLYRTSLKTIDRIELIVFRIKFLPQVLILFILK
jgi:hypothetical protein